MSKLGLVICDSDESYLKRLSDYIMLHYSQRIDLYSFISRGQANIFLKDNNKMQDVLLASSLADISEEALEKVRVVIKLTEGLGQYAGSGCEAVCKYRHTEILVKQILDIFCRKSSDNCMLPGKKATMMIAINSSAGGAGKSSIAAGLSILAGRRGMKAFYLNLERIPSTGLFFRGTSERSFSDIIYYLKEKESNLALKLEGACCFDPGAGVYFFAPPDSAIQMEELEAADLELLFEAFRISSTFDAVFIDMAGGVGLEELFVMKSCDSLVRLHISGALSELKEDLFIKAIKSRGDDVCCEIVSESINVLNRYSHNGRGFSYGDSGKGGFRAVIGESGSLSSYNGERMLLELDTEFTCSLDKLLDAILIDAREASGSGWGCA